MAPEPNPDSVPRHHESGRPESEQERADRNLSDLLQELRVALPGVQVLFAFLLTVPFTQRFTDLSDFDDLSDTRRNEVAANGYDGFALS